MKFNVMKTQMKFQKYLCLAMLIVGALSLVYAFCYASGGLAALGQQLDSDWTAAPGKEDATLFLEIQGFNDALMYCGIVMILLAVLLYITSCHKRRNYYVSNYVATGVCAGGNIVISVVLMALNAMWMGRFKNVDFEAWKENNDLLSSGFIGGDTMTQYSESTAWFVIGFVVYSLVILASVLLVLNLVWKIKLMQGEKKLLNGSDTVEGGAAV